MIQYKKTFCTYICNKCPNDYDELKIRFLIPRTSKSLAHIIFVEGYIVQTFDILIIMSLKEFHQFKCEGKGRSNNQDIRTILNIRVVILGFEALLFPGLTSRNAIKLICLLSDAQDTTKVIIQYY